MLMPCFPLLQARGLSLHSSHITRGIAVTKAYFLLSATKTTVLQIHHDTLVNNKRVITNPLSFIILTRVFVKLQGEIQ